MSDIFDLELEIYENGSFQIQKEFRNYQDLGLAKINAKKHLCRLMPYRGERVYLLKNSRRIGHINKAHKKTKEIMYE